MNSEIIKEEAMFGPRNTAVDVAALLAEGLSNGEIALSTETAPKYRVVVDVTISTSASTSDADIRAAQASVEQRLQNMPGPYEFHVHSESSHTASSEPRPAAAPGGA
jgi:hypothetical protein